MAASHQPLIPSLANSAARVETRRKRRLTSERKEVGLAVHGEQVRWLEPSWLKLADRPPAAGQERRTLKTPLSAYYALSRGREEWLNFSAAKWPHPLPLSLSLSLHSQSLPACLPPSRNRTAADEARCVCVCARTARGRSFCSFSLRSGVCCRTRRQQQRVGGRERGGAALKTCVKEREGGGGGC